MKNKKSELPKTKLDYNKAVIVELARIHKELTRHNSLRFKFLSGIIFGFGSVIGGTVIVSIALFILTQLTDICVIRPWIEGFLNFINA